MCVCVCVCVCVRARANVYGGAQLIEEKMGAREAIRVKAAEALENLDADALEEDRLDAVALRNARARVLVYAKDGYMYDPSKLAFYTSFLFGFVP